ncbi:MAG: GNAT family N-acetyltransferase [Paracoccus sp.]|nr:GNAT family N-acetyltransferase [Paracoccus sp. (in: a-proteobacteria)]
MSQIPHPPDFGPPRIRLRGLEGRDRHDHAAHLLRLSPEDRRARFHAALTDDAIRAYSDGVDWDHALIFGAFVGGVLRGLGELIPWPVRDQGEASFSIEQPFQQIGLGKRLVLATVLAARRAGLGRIHMDFIGDNRAMRALARDVGAVSGRSDGIIHAIKDIPRRGLRAG